MDLKEMMSFNKFIVLDNTLNEDKYAYKIKNALLEKGYTVYAVPEEYDSLNISADILDLCMHPKKSINFLSEAKLDIKGVIIQPGAESDEIKEFLTQKNIFYIESCVLVGLSRFKKDAF